MQLVAYVESETEWCGLDFMHIDTLSMPMCRFLVEEVCLICGMGRHNSNNCSPTVCNI